MPNKPKQDQPNNNERLYISFDTLKVYRKVRGKFVEVKDPPKPK